MTGEVALGILLAHLAGDYLIQSHWMAIEKVKRWWPAVLHGLTYTLPYLLVTRSPWALAIIASTHIVIDRYRLARYVVWFKNQLGGRREYVYRTPEDDEMFADREWPTRYNYLDHAAARPVHDNLSVAPPWATRHRSDPMAWPPTATGYPADTPVWLATALLILADNAIHLIINYGAILWLG